LQEPFGLPGRQGNETLQAFATFPITDRAYSSTLVSSPRAICRGDHS
jgi:hypothetical protein